MNSVDKYPKFLKCNDVSANWNKYLPRPWVKNEIVRVANESEQYPHPSSDITIEDFRKQFVVVYRKDDEGKYTKKQTASWRHFSLINNKI